MLNIFLQVMNILVLVYLYEDSRLDGIVISRGVLSS